MSFSLVHHVMQHKGFTKNKDICTVELKELNSWLKSAANSECLETLPSILISSEDCLTNTDRKIRLLLACCLTQVLRIFDQNQPFSSVENLKVALIFILSQLAQGLQSIDTEEQELSVQLLQYLINIKAFRSTRLIKNGHEILSSMLSVMMPIAEQASANQRNLILQLIKDVLDDPVLMMEPKVLMAIAESIVSAGPHSNLAAVLTLRGAEKSSGKAMTEVSE
ncbi:hypothetical protein B566_EDAN013044 [Ephemera danica]|nr:hypothetical protein B566_EDAN013044 [Ephemera danica]